MPLEHLLAALERDAHADIERVGAEGRAAAAALAAESDALAARRRDAALAAREHELRAAAAATLARARAEARRAVLEARHALLERVFAGTRARLPAAATEPAALDIWRQRVTAAFACVGELPATLHCAPALAPLLRQAIRSRPAVTVVTDRSLGTGFRLEAAGLSVDATLEDLLERRRPALAVAALRDIEAGP